MRRTLTALIGSAALIAGGLIADLTLAQDDGVEKILQVVRIDTHDNTGAYLEGLRVTLARLAELAPDTKARVWQARFSGDTTGTIYVTIEYPDMASFAASGKVIANDEAWADSIKALEATGRTIESQSLLADVTP